ncbi:cytochrome P450 [Cercophora samala]|uniref:Cytochrome P450 n=1 Tax=Cercophora samala TaxID=330535 RepID=A0AA39Z889_9PEZI|nr:cytochrome P450 [Cercophora samala]
MMARSAVFSPTTALLAFIVVLAIVLQISRKKRQRESRENITTVGIDSKTNRYGITTRPSALLRSLISTSEWARDGYRIFSKAGRQRAFAIPSMWTGSDVVVLPPSLLASVLNRPETELAAHHAQLDTIQLPYMMSDSDVYDNPIQYDVVRRTMSRQNVRSLAAPTAEALDVAFSAYWSTPHKNDDGWTVLNNWDACGKVFTRVAMLSLVGPPLCHDEELLDWARKYASSVITGTAFINCLPPGWMRSGAGPLFGLQARYYQSRCLRIMVPVIRERVQKLQDGGGRDVDDFLQSTILRCSRTGDPGQMNPRRIALRLLGLATMSIMGLVYVFTHCIGDIYGMPSQKREELLAALRAECEREAQADDHGEFSLLDSTLNESMRLNNISVTSLARDVATDTLHISGTDSKHGHGDDDVFYTLSRGDRIVFPTQNMHRDEDVFGKNPGEFDPFRFSRELQTGSGRFDDMCKSLLVFGYGKHACPGRHYAMQTLKQTLAYVVVNYDVALIGPVDSDGGYALRGKRQTLLNVNVPNIDLKTRVRRRT